MRKHTILRDITIIKAREILAGRGWGLTALKAVGAGGGGGRLRQYSQFRICVVCALNRWHEVLF